MSVGVMGLEQILGHGVDQRSGQNERGHHREDHRQRHRHEQIARHALQEKHRHEYDADTEQRDKGGGHDLARAVHDRGLHILALLEMPVDVFNGDGGIVNQNAHGQRQTPKRHQIERFTNGRQPQDGAHDGQGNGRSDDEGRAPASQKQQDHQAGERGGNDALHGHTRHCGSNEDGLIIDGCNG